ncbi:MAG: HD domain-containing protein [Nitriliruptorales bacterium]
MTRLDEQIAFLLEADRLKGVLRRSKLADASRRENSAEHSWHLALFAAILVEHAAEEVDLLRVMRMLIVHDLVEIDAGDTFAYDAEATLTKAQRERDAADRLFALLPDDQGREWRALWDEFEARDTPDARFAAAVDRLQPVLLNHASGGAAWVEHGITADQVVAFNRHIEQGAPELWEHAQRVIAAATEAGHLRS